MQEQYWLLESPFHQLPLAIIHQQSMPIVYRVPQLECKHCISMHLSELGSQLIGCQSVLVKAIIPEDSPQDLHFSSNQPVSTIIDNFYIWMSFIEYSELPCTSLLFPVFIELRIPDDGFCLSVVSQGELLIGTKLFLGLRRNRQDYRNRLVGHSIIQETVEMLALQILTLSHETC